MPLPVSYYGITIADSTQKKNGEPESTSSRVPTATITAANYDAQIGLASAFKSALDAIVIGNLLKDTVTAAESSIGTGIAGTSLAQRENKWLCRYHDATTNQKFQVSFGTADLSLLPLGTEFLDLADAGVGAAFKTAFQNLVKSPSDVSHSVILDSVQFVGRNT